MVEMILSILVTALSLGATISITFFIIILLMGASLRESLKFATYVAFVSFVAISGVGSTIAVFEVGISQLPQQMNRHIWMRYDTPRSCLK